MNQRIPGLVPGILLLSCAAVLAAPVDLAVDLFAEGEWAGARREAERVLTGEPDNDAARLLAAVARLREGRDTPAIRTTLAGLAATASAETGVMAAYELARLEWRDGNLPAAFGHFLFVFETASSPDLFRRGGCSLDAILRSRPGLGANHEAVLQQLKTSANLWTPEVCAECLPARPRIGAKPGEWVVRFYRGQVRPAIGTRCILEPSCSEYFLQASRAHGLLGIPMAADRLVREPAVVQAGENPLPAEPHERYPDPVSAHDYWMKGDAP
jgi:putative component of membrane protein insertase Oxa1/YidC/SpoIIIJ protein YidD